MTMHLDELHRWSGWPGAWCLDCGVEDARELCLADGHLHAGSLEQCVNAPCSMPGSNWHNPYVNMSDVTCPYVHPGIGICAVCRAVFCGERRK